MIGMGILSSSLATMMSYIRMLVSISTMNLVMKTKTDIDVSVDVQTMNSGQKRNKCNGLGGRESHIEKQREAAEYK